MMHISGWVLGSFDDPSLYCCYVAKEDAVVVVDNVVGKLGPFGLLL